ncbi:type I-U CRISPR-associated helicase/endonuclease Cas3 [Desulfuromonas versatilis]|uniref:Type I-U CRISPR-associated helicase/endonuclease Cas3 n=1 Tax=Desulfuromonas versatilis TaxID=2802975 RepID=A0ABN6E0G5_9BACT|nr:type I-U CRISPR-associated helicase/endonuclease Cas3 [Desulfuromonas versatilis]
MHDEAHLEPAFQEMLSAIAAEQRRCQEFGLFRVMELTATSRSDASGEEDLFTEEDQTHGVARKRLGAKKGIAFHPVDDERRVADKVEQLAKGYKDSGQAILVFLRGVREVTKVAAALRKVVPECVETLTGTLRGYERDALARENSIFARFLPSTEATPRTGTVYLLCTSAGEVGVNISADHLVCDLTPFDSMMQRFGRVNRFGAGDARIDVVHRTYAKDADAREPESSTKTKEKPFTPFDRACGRTLTVLQRLPMRDDQRRDANPVALSKIPVADRQAAFTPPPGILPTSEILFDAWALTTVRQKLPGRPPVADWLHGVTEWEQPATHIAWRDEVGFVGGMSQAPPPEDLLEDYPLKPHELLRDQTPRVFSELEKVAARCPLTPVWLLNSDGVVEVLSLTRLVERDKQKKPVLNLADCTVLLPPVVGGLEGGILNGDAGNSSGAIYDIADHWLDGNGRPRRCRVWDDDDPPLWMRLVRTIDVRPDGDEEEDEEADSTSRRYWHWYVRPRSADDEGSRTARIKEELTPHLCSAEDFATRLVDRLGLEGLEAKAVVLATRWHDRGKDRLVWQRSIGNRDYPQQVLAKSGPGMWPINLSEYRHEFGSLVDLSSDTEFLELPAEIRDLVLHLVAAHHGRARPHFPAHETFDPNWPDMVTMAIVNEIPRRYGRLQRKYGRWGLAYLESLVRSADAMASQLGPGEVFADGGVSPSQGGV